MKLRLSAPSTAGRESSLWATPNTLDHLLQRSPKALERMKETTWKGRSTPPNLREQVDEGTIALWRTPKATDAERGPCSKEGAMKKIEKKQSIRLQDQVNHPTLFRTPDAGCSRGAQSPERFAKSVGAGKLLTLNDQIAHLFPTPTVHGDYNRKGSSAHSGDGLATYVKNVLAEGALNPAWVEWLMGFPAGWTVPGGSMSPIFQE
jgi:hypothetical protein